MNWTVIFMCFAVPFAITAGIAAPFLIGTWIERRLGLSTPSQTERNEG